MCLCLQYEYEQADETEKGHDRQGLEVNSTYKIALRWSELPLPFDNLSNHPSYRTLQNPAFPLQSELFTTRVKVGKWVLTAQQLQQLELSMRLRHWCRTRASGWCWCCRTVAASPSAWRPSGRARAYST